MIDVFELLGRELGPHKIVRDEERLERFLVDESGLFRCASECAVLAESRADVEVVLRLAREHRVPVTPRGAGTGMTGGCLPARGGIVLSTERMTKIYEIDTDDLVAVVEPGVVTGDLQAAVEAAGLFYPPDPASLASCTLGGNVAENAGGPRAFKYGVTREYVLGMECVRIGGEVLRTGRRTQKGVVGYDVTAAIVGSRRAPSPSPPSLTLQALAQAAGGARRCWPCFADPDRAAGDAVTRAIHLGARPAARSSCSIAATIDAPARGRVHPIDVLRQRRRRCCLVRGLDGDPEGLDKRCWRCAQACEAAGAVDIV